jgi:DNA-binding NtrC family response regulator
MNATLLIADGQAASRTALARFFSRCGFRVETARNTLECLIKLRLLRPDVLVADVETLSGGADAVVAFVQESRFELPRPDVVIVGNAPPTILSERTGVPEPSCFEKPLRAESVLERVGLVVALIDLRRKRQAQARRRRLRVPTEAAMPEMCLT